MYGVSSPIVIDSCKRMTLELSIEVSQLLYCMPNTQGSTVTIDFDPYIEVEEILGSTLYRFQNVRLHFNVLFVRHHINK